jgi:tRNA(adenine34) deaminase
MASKKVSPKGIGSGIRMVQYFLNRGGKNLPERQRSELEKGQAHPPTEGPRGSKLAG